MGAQFTLANSEYLSKADNASLSMGDIDFTICGWMYLDAKATYQYGIAKYNYTPNKREYSLAYNNAADLFEFAVSGDGTTTQRTIRTAATLGSPSTGTWYFVLAWHDATANTINIMVNDGAADSSAHTTGVFDSDSTFNLGSSSLATPDFFLGGRMQGVGVWKRTLTTAEKTYLYNAGVGRAYDELDPTLRTSLISYWELNEPSGTRTDLHSANNLTDNNTVTTNPGTILNAVGTWRDLSGQGRNATQATQANKPVFRQSILAGKPVVRFDGVNDEMAIAGLDIAQNVDGISMFCVVQTTLPGASGQPIFISNGIVAVNNRAGLFRELAVVGAMAVGGRRLDADAFAKAESGNVLTAGVYSIDSGVFDYRNTIATVYKNGVQQATNTSFETTGASEDTASLAVYIGSGNGTAWINGDIAEVIIYKRALNNAERSRVERYLSQKYGIALT